MTVTSAIPRGETTATLNFYHPPTDDKSFQPYNIVNPGPGGHSRNYEDKGHEVVIHDARGRESDFTLDRDAFQFIQGVAPSAERDFTDDDSIAKNYYPEVEQLVLSTVPGATKVRIFDHTVRRADPNADRRPVQTVHVDQTAKSTQKRVRHNFPEDEAERLLEGRYRIINVWRPIGDGPVESDPLAFASAASTRDDDIVPVEHRYASGYTGETGAVRYSPDHQWYYLSGMTPDERILIECFDSESLRPGSGIKGRVPHTAFTHPRTRPDAKKRESIEVRVLVFGP